MLPGRTSRSPCLVCYKVSNIAQIHTRGGTTKMPNPSQPRVETNMVIRNIGQLVTVAQQPVAGASGPLQIIDHAALAMHDGIIVWLGRDDDTEPMFQHDPDSIASEIATID